MNGKMFLCSHLLQNFVLDFFLILKAPKINYSDRKVIVGVQRSLWKTHNY